MTYLLSNVRAFLDRLKGHFPFVPRAYWLKALEDARAIRFQRDQARRQRDLLIYCAEAFLTADHDDRPAPARHRALLAAAVNGVRDSTRTETRR